MITMPARAREAEETGAGEEPVGVVVLLEGVLDEGVEAGGAVGPAGG